ncbi:MAG: hypothetical protein GY793_05725 [Proteobacteria bacterium]|nr:hypothetical protein [Pseudomonadota bacterium]
MMEGTKSDLIGNIVEVDGCIKETEKEVDEEMEEEVFTTETKEIRVSHGKPRGRHDTCYWSISETPEITKPVNDEREGEREGNDEDNEPDMNEKEEESTKKDNKMSDEVKGHESEENDSEEEMKEDGNNEKETTKTKNTNNKKQLRKVKNACTVCGKEVKKEGSIRCAGCFRNCHTRCIGYKNTNEYLERKDQTPAYECKECNEKPKRGRPKRRNSLPDRVIQKRKRIVEEGLPKKVSPPKKRNKVGEANPEVTDGEDWKSEKTQI